MKLVKMVGSIALVTAACWTGSAPPPAAPATQQASADEPSKEGSASKPRDLVQPVKIETRGPYVPIETGDGNDVEGGISGGDLSDVVAAPPPPPPLPPPPPMIAPVAFEAQRIAGDRNILPDPDTRTEIIALGKERVSISYKLCLDASGNIQRVALLKSTGFPAYDRKIETTIRNEWRYQPFLIKGKPDAVCSAVTLIYAAPPPPPPPPHS